MSDAFDCLAGAVIRLFAANQQLAARLDKLEAAPRRKPKPKVETAAAETAIPTPAPSHAASRAKPQPENGPTHPLRKWRRHHDVSLDRVAEFCATTKATISRIETGAQYPKPDLLARLAALTSLDADDFFAWFTAAGAAE